MDTDTQKMTEKDTICAIATPPGSGGIAVIRLSGPEAFKIADSVWKGKKLSAAQSHTAHLGTIMDGADILDQSLATIFRGPHSYTGEDTIEFSVHGSPYIQKRVIEVLCDNGARIAGPGEYTRRAFIAGNIDLSQAEAIADLIAARSRAAHRVAVGQLRGGVSQRLAMLRQRLIDLGALLELELDFSEEDVEFASRTQLIDLATEIHDEVERLHDTYRRGAAIKEGIPIAIAGPTNAGKSSLLNALVGEDRAIVSDIHGTTRDTVEETLTIGDNLVRLIDTAGLRDTDNTVERIGIERTHRTMERAALLLLVVDAAEPSRLDLQTSPIPQTQPIIAIVNKTDATDPTVAINTLKKQLPSGTPIAAISVRTGSGMQQLRYQIERRIKEITGDVDADILITNARQAQALAGAAQSAAAVRTALLTNIPADLIAIDIRQTIDHLSSITGAITSDTLLHTIFSRFCVGK
ncbi:MAG: tRNA uridine-5-carboxymethylaminomethyl(34) synthesis GTPase MnmE [Bacteroidales bacterium]|nr:tRNA uridine-5-carboxymethylaminomethyl(34) synthesis GTPase MnmE [Bacteroidales bacterium]